MKVLFPAIILMIVLNSCQEKNNEESSIEAAIKQYVSINAQVNGWRDPKILTQDRIDLEIGCEVIKTLATYGRDVRKEGEVNQKNPSANYYYLPLLNVLRADSNLVNDAISVCNNFNDKNVIEFTSKHREILCKAFDLQSMDCNYLAENHSYFCQIILTKDRPSGHLKEYVDVFPDGSMNFAGRTSLEGTNHSTLMYAGYCAELIKEKNNRFYK